eukprot:gene12686-13894_t
MRIIFIVLLLQEALSFQNSIWRFSEKKLLFPSRTRNLVSSSPSSSSNNAPKVIPTIPEDIIKVPNSTASFNDNITYPSNFSSNFYSNLFGFSSPFLTDSNLLLHALQQVPQSTLQYFTNSNRTLTSTSANFLKKLPKDASFPPFVQLTVTNDSVAFQASNTYEINALKQDVSTIKSKMDKIEKTLDQLSSMSSPSSTSLTTNYGLAPMFASASTGQLSAKTNNFVGAISALTSPSLSFDAKTIETCGIVVFFGLGSVLGASLFDRLWLIGGIITAYWSTTVINQNSNQGIFVRRLAVKFAQLINDIMEKYNQFVIFYRTGQLAYVSSKVWKEYDDRFDFTNKINYYKKLTMDRAVLQYNNSTNFLTKEWNKLFPANPKQNQFMNSYQNLAASVSDVYKAVLTAPTKAKKLDQKYQVTTSLQSFSKNLLTGTRSTLKEIFRPFDESEGKVVQRTKNDERKWLGGFSGFQKEKSNKSLNNPFSSFLNLPSNRNNAIRRSSSSYVSSSSRYSSYLSSSSQSMNDWFITKHFQDYWQRFISSISIAVGIILDDSSNKTKKSTSTAASTSFLNGLFPSKESGKSQRTVGPDENKSIMMIKKIVATLYLIGLFEVSRQVALVRIVKPLVLKIFR